MNYAGFKTFISTFLWKQNDSVLIDNLDNLILLANADLERELRLSHRNVSEVVSVSSTTFLTSALTSPLRTIKSIVLNDPTRIIGRNPMSAATVATVRSKQIIPLSGGIYDTYAMLNKDTILFAGNISADLPADMAITYRKGIPDFADADTSWVADEYFDVYLYGVLMHTAPFLREDERVGLWQSLYKAALTSANDESLWEVEYGGSPLHVTPVHRHPIRRRW
jgi:hypothetical protein